ncbi:MAG: ATP-grasp domain-containing protein [Calditrichia bacterium]
MGEFLSALEEVRKILSEKTVISRGTEESNYLLVEDYIPGSEVAVEGMLINGDFKLLTIFDKPDPLEGPYFTETIYVTPSRLPAQQQEEIVETTKAVCRSLGLSSGPVHAELRLNEKGAWIIEIAARSIGGLCSRALRFTGNISLEEIILRHSLGMDISRIEREEAAAGVMMMPVPKSGILKKVSGINNAKNVPGVEDIVVTTAPQQEIAPLPFGNRYLGFIFARGDSSEFVEGSIREAFVKIKIEME